MSTETDRLEREAEERRANVDATLDQLRDRLSVNSIVDEVTTLVRDGNGADLARNLGRQVRDNPLALGLVGAGLAWLFAGPGVRDSAGNLRRGYDDWRYDRFAEAFPPGREDNRERGWEPRRDYRDYRDAPRGYASDYGADMANDFSPMREGPRDLGREGTVGYVGPAGSGTDDGPGIADRARDAASGAGARLSGAASSASDRVSGAASAASDRLSDAAGRVSDTAQSAYEAARRRGHDLSDAAWRAEQAAARGLSRAGDGIGYAGRRIRRTFLDTLAEEPLIVGAVALAIGAAVGAALPSTRREDELFGETRDRLRDEAYAYGKDAVQRAETVAEKTYRAASEEAEKKGLKPTGEGETLAEKVGSVARAAVDTARSEVRNETAGARGDDRPDGEQSRSDQTPGSAFRAP